MQDPYTDLEINCRSQLSHSRGLPPLQPGGEGRVRRHAPGLRSPRFTAGHRASPRAADRRQRHQQGGGRVLPPRLQQRVRRARVLAAADERLRPTAADQAQPPGVHRVVHPAGARRSRDPDLRRRHGRFATSSTSTTAPTRSCVPARAMRSNGQVFNVGGTEPITHRDLVELLISAAGSGRYRFVEWPPEKKAIDIGDFYADSSLIAQTLGWRAGDTARRRAHADAGLLSRAHAALRADDRQPGRRAVTPGRDPLPRSASGR